MQLLDQVSKGFPYRKIFFEPFGKEYFLYIDSDQAALWTEKEGTMGCFCPLTALEIDNSEDKNCRAVMVAPLKEIQTVVHECAHAGFHFSIDIVYEKTGEALEEKDEDFQQVEECTAHTIGVITAQVLQSETIEEIREQFRQHAPRFDKTQFKLDKDGEYRYNPTQS